MIAPRSDICACLPLSYSYLALLAVAKAHKRIYCARNSLHYCISVQVCLSTTLILYINFGTTNNTCTTILRFSPSQKPRVGRSVGKPPRCLNVSSGELLRQYIRGDSDEAKNLSKIMSEGQIVPAQVLLSILFALCKYNRSIFLHNSQQSRRRRRSARDYLTCTVSKHAGHCWAPAGAAEQHNSSPLLDRWLSKKL